MTGPDDPTRPDGIGADDPTVDAGVHDPTRPPPPADRRPPPPADRRPPPPARPAVVGPGDDPTLADLWVADQPPRAARRSGRTGRGERPRRSVLWFLVSAPLVLALVAATTVQAMTVLAHDEHDATRQYPPGAIDTVVIDSVAGQVTVIGSDRESVRVSARVSRGWRRTGFSQRRQGSQLLVNATCPLYGSNFCDVNLRVEVPRQTAVTVLADDHVTVRQVDGAVQAKTRAASMDVDDLGGRVALQATEGSIEATAMRATDLTASSTNGSITIDSEVATNRLVAATTNGSVRVGLPAARYRVTATSDNGAVNNALGDDPASSRTVDLRTVNGSVELRAR